MIYDVEQNPLNNAFSTKPPKQGDLVFCYSGEEILIKNQDGRFVLPTYGEITPKCHHIFAINGKDCYLAEEQIPPFGEYDYLNTRILMTSFSDYKIFLVATTGLQLFRWEKSRAFCGCCGTPTVRSQKERAMVCPKCNNTEYPKICPATITAITHNGKLLMARHTKNPKRGYGLIAGFCEIGETFEQNVQREVMEEVGLKVKNVTYFKNQPWGITDSHMIGFLAQLDGDDETVRLQEDEIVEARWFTPDEITPPANNFSLYSQLVLNFLATNGAKNK